MSDGCKLKSMDDFYTFIKDTRETVETKLKMMKDMSQQEVDEFIRTEINGPMNEKIARKRAELINSLSEQYTALTAQKEEADNLIAPMQSLLSASISIDTVVSIVGDIIGLLKGVVSKLVQSYVVAQQFIVLAASHLVAILEETNKLQNIQIEGLNTKALNIKCEPISMGDITGGAGAEMPPLSKPAALKKGINLNGHEFLEELHKHGDAEESIFKSKSCACGCVPPDIPLPF